MSEHTPKLTRIKRRPIEAEIVDEPEALEEEEDVFANAPKTDLPTSVEEFLKVSGTNAETGTFHNHNMYFFAKNAIEDFCKKHTGVELFGYDCKYPIKVGSGSDLIQHGVKTSIKNASEAESLFYRCKEIFLKLLSLSATRQFSDEYKDDKGLNKEYHQDRIKRLSEKLGMKEPLNIKTKKDVARECDRAFIEIIKSDRELFEQALVESAQKAGRHMSSKSDWKDAFEFRDDLTIEENFERIVNVFNEMSPSQMHNEAIDAVAFGGTSSFAASAQLALFIFYAKTIRQHIAPNEKALSLSAMPPQIRDERQPAP